MYAHMTFSDHSSSSKSFGLKTVGKAVRAAVILIPVFGLQFLFTIYRLPDLTHQVINLVLDGLQ
ncbi:hypothetical protein TELCIR_12048, partial [Teladorsagia circumcincta]